MNGVSGRDYRENRPYSQCFNAWRGRDGMTVIEAS